MMTKFISAVRDYFKGIRFRYLLLAIGIFALLDIGNHMLHGDRLGTAVTALPHKWPVYLIMIIAYTIASKIKQLNQTTGT